MPSAMQLCRRLPGLLSQGWSKAASASGSTFSTSAANSATPAAATAAASASPATLPPAFLSWMSPSSVSHAARISVPLSQALPEAALGSSGQQHRTRGVPSEPPPTEITVLPNGARIVSEGSSGPTASLGLYVNSGSIWETSYDAGSSALLECLAFKSTKHRTTGRIMKEIEKVGSSVMANASREQMSYTIDCLKTSVPSGLELLADAVLNPRFTQAEVDEQKQRLTALLGGKDVQMTLLNEELVRRAYGGALSHPLIPDLDQLSRLTPSVLHDFVARNYAAPRLVLAAAGVDHAELVRLATPMLAPLPAGPAVDATGPSSEYVGAFVHLPGSFPQSNAVLAFEYRGGWQDVNGAVVMTVLTYLLGGGNSFSSGGPGKGMHSRLYTRVLNQYPWAHSCSAFNSTFNSTGLVGVQAACDPPHVHDMLDVMCNEMEAVARSVSPPEVERAKAAAISVICNALESKATSAEDIGRQYLTYGHRISGREYVTMIQAVTPAQVQAFVAALLQSRPSLAVYGDKTEDVQYQFVLNRYQSAPPKAAKPRSVLGRLWKSSSS